MSGSDGVRHRGLLHEGQSGIEGSQHREEPGTKGKRKPTAPATRQSRPPGYNQPDSRAIRIASMRLRAPVFLETAFR